MRVNDKAFNEEYQRICEAWRKYMKSNQYTSNPDWLWLDGRKTAMEWISKMNEES